MSTFREGNEVIPDINLRARELFETTTSGLPEFGLIRYHISF